MVFFAITRNGFDAYRSLCAQGEPLWVGAEVLSEVELASLRLSGVDVSDFNYRIGLQEIEVIADAVATIKEHHPGQVIWVEQ